MNIVTKVAGQVLAVGVTRAVGEPVDLGGGRLVPVAIVAHAFGGGGDQGDGDVDGAGGAGGSTFVWPVGAYVGDESGVRFRGNPVLWGVVAAPLVLATGIAAALVVRAARR